MNKKISGVLFALLFVGLLGFTSCGGDDDGDPKVNGTGNGGVTALKEISDAWTADAIGKAKIDASAPGITGEVKLGTLNITGNNAVFTLTGTDGLVTGGTFSIDNEGKVTNPVITLGGNTLVLDGTPSISLTKTKMTIEFKLKAAPASRVGGVGEWTVSVTL